MAEGRRKEQYIIAFKNGNKLMARVSTQKINFYKISYSAT